MSGARQIAVGAGSLAALWLQEWRTLSDKIGLGSSALRHSAHLVIRTDKDLATVALRVSEGEDVALDRCSLSMWSRERLSLAAQKAQSRLHGKKVVTVLSCAQAVTGALIVPHQARSQAGDIIRDHLRRKMPMPLEDLVLGSEVRTAAPGKLELVYLAVPRRQVEDGLARLSLHPSDIQALQAPAGPSLPPVTVPYGESAVGSKNWIRRGGGLLGLVALLAPLAGFGAQAWRQKLLLSDLEAQVISVSEQARASTERLKAVYSLAGDLEQLAEIGAVPGMVVIWDELARLLPDTSYLTAFEVRGSELHAEGLSASTSDLIQRLEGSQHLHAVSLTGPIVFDRDQGKEHFTLRALIRKRRFPMAEGG
jgi:general secretion pathway protein L